MKRYQVQSSYDRQVIMEVSDTHSNTMRIRIIRTVNGKSSVEETTMSQELLALCDRTGYIHLIPEPIAAVA